ncbi:MAG: hypothetical protein HYZ50_22185 [Deltaproteobacteria bacterium]|nr:hypothetical protein [Deltaproteobacteria bacterium]
MTDEELKEKIKEVLSEMGVWSGHREMTIDDIATIQPGLARIMPDVGIRTWKLYYAAKEGHWELANFQWKEVKELMELGAFTRPKHEDALNQFMAEDWPPLGQAIKDKDFEAFEKAFHHAVSQANAYHELKEKPYIRWQLPDHPPPDLDMKPRGAAKK